MYIPDLDAVVYSPGLHAGVVVRSVGWLGDRVPSTGSLAPGLLDTLKTLRRIHGHDDGRLGDHTCEICGDHHERGELAIDHGGIRYVAPRMIVHYIEAHGYLPPEPFLDAIRHAPPEPNDYRSVFDEHDELP
jgi:hypothetical protein